LPPRPSLPRITCNSHRQHLFAVPPRFTTKPINQTTTEGAKAITFYCTASGYPNPNITWIKDDKILATGDTLRLNTSRNNSGEYWCSAENGLNVTVKASASLNVLCKYFFSDSTGSLLIIKILNVSKKSYFKQGNHLLFVTLSVPYLTGNANTWQLYVSIISFN